MPEPFAPLLARKKLVGWAQETVSGTFQTGITTPMASTYVTDIKCNPEDFFSDGKREPQGNFVGSVDSLAGKLKGKLSFTVYVTPGDQTLPLLAICGMKLTGGVWAPTSDMSAKKTGSFAVWQAGKRYELAGVVGTVVFELAGATRVLAKFDLSGKWVQDLDEAMPVQTPIQAHPYLAKGMTITSDGAAMPHMSSVTITLGAVIEERPSLTDAGYLAHMLVTDLDPTISLDPEARLVAQNDQYGELKSGATHALVVSVALGTTPSLKTLLFTAGRVQRTQVSDETRDKKFTHKVDLACRITAGDDALTIAETTA